MFEVFSLFDHANYEAYITEESGKQRELWTPTQTPGLNFRPRMVQLGFRAMF